MLNSEIERLENSEEAELLRKERPGRTLYLEINGMVLVDFTLPKWGKPVANIYEVAQLVTQITETLANKKADDESIYSKDLMRWVRPERLRLFPVIPGFEVQLLIINALEVLKFAVRNGSQAFKQLRGPLYPGDFLDLAKSEAEWQMEERRLRRLVAQVAEELEAGRKQSEIIASILQTERLGDNSETAVYAALQKLPYVAQITAHQKWSDTDYLAGIDLTVIFTAENEFGIERIDLQVKSSKKGIQKARKELQEKHSCGDATELSQHLADVGLILINGNQSEEDIVASFEGQLRELIARRNSVDHLAVLQQRFRVTFS